MKIKNLPINWTDGIKLNQDHFLNNYYSTVEIIKNYNLTSQKKYDFGILDEIDGHTEAIKLDLINNSAEEIVLKLISCNAVAESGYKIVYYEGIYGVDYTPVKSINASDFDKYNNQVFYVILTINPYELVPVGIPDPEVIPLHHPNALPKISIDIVPLSKINASYLKENFLVVGKINFFNGSFTFDKEYIPPVKKIDYNKNLKSFKESLVQTLLRCKEHSIQIIKKNKKNNKSNKLVENTFVLCYNMNDFYSQVLFCLEGVIGEHSPITLVEKISILANSFSISFSIMDEKEREELMQYYYEWTDIKPSDFLNAIGDVLSIQYNHIEIYETIVKLNNLMGIVGLLFKKMSNLEYIGQRKDNIVISEESTLVDHKPKSSSWSIID